MGGGQGETTVEEVDRTVGDASHAFSATAGADDQTRAAWLEAVAAALDDESRALIPIAADETHLPRPRLEGEVARTTGQLRMFADVLRDGAYLEVVIDGADPSATPPRPDLRRMLRPIGPVAVYAASNFPFAFSVAGGDTASALAAGCPVVVKAHPAHPRLSRATGTVVAEALADAGAPEGAFAVVSGHDAGVSLVEHPGIAAAAFTGSLSGGRALFDRAAARPAPIPFYGELASINPVVVTASADHRRGGELAQGLAQSFQLGMGQFCTKPGLVLVPEGSRLEAAIAGMLAPAAHPMLTDAMARAFVEGVGEYSRIDGVTEVAAVDSASHDAPQPRVLAVNARDFGRHADALTAEVFGPVTVLVRYTSAAELHEAIGHLPGSLTGTVHAESDDEIADLVAALTARCGRVLFDGWPTGVAVTWSQHHGGPYPATTSIHTSVGATAVRRFLRPVVYQDAPAAVLPAALRDGNPLRIPRRVNGVLELPAR